MHTERLSPAAQAFDDIALRFDERFGSWLSVAAQRRAVRRQLLRAFEPRSRVLEIGGGTGEDAVWLQKQGREVLLTDAAPSMVSVAKAKLGSRPEYAPIAIAAERLSDLADERARCGLAPFDGAFSNFAALNCVSDLREVGQGIARLVRVGAPLLIVAFGVMPIGEWVVQLARGKPRAAFRRLSSGDVHARLGSREFTVRYHRTRDIELALRPFFRLLERRGIGVFVPPSAAEPWISTHPCLVAALEGLDRAFARPLALLGDHVLHRFIRTDMRSTE